MHKEWNEWNKFHDNSNLTSDPFSFVVSPSTEHRAVTELASNTYLFDYTSNWKGKNFY